MRIRFWGTRGSIAVPGQDTVRYGGNTSCVEVVTENGTLFILDCGTGVREFGQHLVEAKRLPVTAAILLSHTHWDHIQGFPFFMPAFFPGNEFNIHSSRGSDKKLEEVLAGQMEYTYFPVTLTQMGARISVREIGEETLNIGDSVVDSMYLNHTSLCLGYRIRNNDTVLVYATDHETFSRFVRETRPGSRPQQRAEMTAANQAMADAKQEEFLNFIRGADLLIHDAQYTEQEYPDRQGWGHSTCDDAVRTAIAAGVRRLALFHHDPGHSDDTIDDMLKACRELVRREGADLEVIAAAEAAEIHLPSPAPATGA